MCPRVLTLVSLERCWAALGGSDASLCCPCSGWKWLRCGGGMWRWMDINISLCCPDSLNLVKLRRRYVSMDGYFYQPIVFKQLVGRNGFAASL